jgi:hypothetical protein
VSGRPSERVAKVGGIAGRAAAVAAIASLGVLAPAAGAVVVVPDHIRGGMMSPVMSARPDGTTVGACDFDPKRGYGRGR